MRMIDNLSRMILLFCMAQSNYQGTQNQEEYKSNPDRANLFFGWINFCAFVSFYFLYFIFEIHFLSSFDLHLKTTFGFRRHLIMFNYVIFYCAGWLHKNHFIIDIINIIKRLTFALCYSITRFAYGKELFSFIYELLPSFFLLLPTSLSHINYTYTY